MRQLATVAIGFAVNAILARALAPQGMGIYQAVILISVAGAAVGGLGLDTGAVYHLNRGGVEFYSARSTMMISGAAMGFFLSVATFLFGRELLTERLLPVMMIIPLQLAANAGAAYWLGRHEFGRYNLCVVSPQIVMLIGLGLLYASHGISPLSATWTYALSLAIATFIPSWFHVQKFSGNRVIDISFARKCLGYGWKAYLGDLITFVNYRSDMFVVGHFAGASALGLYSIAVMVAERIWFASQAASTALFPTISAMKAGDAELVGLTPIVLRRVLVFSALVGLAVECSAGWAVPYFFGQRFEGSVLPLRLLVPGVVIWGGARVLCADIAGRGLPEVNLKLAAVSAALNVMLNVAIVPHYGAAGAAFSSSVSYSVLGVMALRSYLQLSGLSINELLGVSNYKVWNYDF